MQLVVNLPGIYEALGWIPKKLGLMCTPVIPALWRERPDDQEFKVIIYIYIYFQACLI